MADWVEYKCKSGEGLFLYNKKTGEHKWQSSNDSSKEGVVMVAYPVIYKEMCNTATQTDDNSGCVNECTSIYAENVLRESNPKKRSNNIGDNCIESSSEMSNENETNIMEYVIEENILYDRVEMESSPESHLDNNKKNNSYGQSRRQSKRAVNIHKTLQQDKRQDNGELTGDSFEHFLTEDDHQDIGNNNNLTSHYNLFVQDEITADNQSKISYNNYQREGDKVNMATLKHKKIKRIQNQCPFCDKIFSRNSSLKRHIRIHFGERPFKCNICAKKFTHKEVLTNHMRMHTGEKPFECHLCKKKFAQRANLLSHERTHSGEKPYECSLCNKTFSLKNNLVRHQKTHTQEKPFQCNICTKNFSLKQNLDRHQRCHIQSSVSGQEIMLGVTMGKKTKYKPHQCSLCHAKFTQNASLKRHMKGQHQP